VVKQRNKGEREKWKHSGIDSSRLELFSSDRARNSSKTMDLPQTADGTTQNILILEKEIAKTTTTTTTMDDR
jgi:hypothetical protein